MIDEKYGQLRLTNGGELQVFFLGVGGAFSTLWSNTNFLIVKGDTHLLVDFGITGPAALRRNGLSPGDITAVLPTHSHSDHAGGLEHLSLHHRYVSHTKPRILLDPDFQEDLWDNTLSGGLQDNETGGLVFEDYFEPVHFGRRESIEGRGTWRLSYGSLDIEVFSTLHTTSDYRSVGLVVDERVMFSGDSRFQPGTIEHYGPRVETIFHDCSFPEGNPHHASLGQLKTLPDTIRKKMWVVHYGDDYNAHDLSGLGGRAKQDYWYTWEGAK